MSDAFFEQHDAAEADDPNAANPAPAIEAVFSIERRLMA
jgi:hypothetical protein